MSKKDWIEYFKELGVDQDKIAEYLLEHQYILDQILKEIYDEKLL